jgi:predicted transporter
MKGIVIIGAILAILGLVGLATPVFTTSSTTNVATLGDLKVQATEHTSHAIPPVVSGGVMILGLVLVGAGLYTNR